MRVERPPEWESQWLTAVGPKLEILGLQVCLELPLNPYCYISYFKMSNRSDTSTYHKAAQTDKNSSSPLGFGCYYIIIIVNISRIFALSQSVLSGLHIIG